MLKLNDLLWRGSPPAGRQVTALPKLCVIYFSYYSSWCGNFKPHNGTKEVTSEQVMFISEIKIMCQLYKQYNLGNRMYRTWIA